MAWASVTWQRSRPEGENPSSLMPGIQDAMPEHAPRVRDEAGLSAGLEKLSGLKIRAEACGTGGGTSRAFNPGWHTAYDLRSLVVNAEALLRSALMRKESRGAHARSDYPSSDDQLAAVNYIVEKGSGDMQVRPEARTPMPGYLADAVQRSYARYTPEETE